MYAITPSDVGSRIGVVDGDCVILKADEAKLVLALALAHTEDPGWQSTQLDGLFDDLAVALFGARGRLLDPVDVDQLKREAFSEWNTRINPA